MAPHDHRTRRREGANGIRTLVVLSVMSTALILAGACTVSTDRPQSTSLTGVRGTAVPEGPSAAPIDSTADVCVLLAGAPPVYFPDPRAVTDTEGFVAFLSRLAELAPSELVAAVQILRDDAASAQARGATIVTLIGEEEWRQAWARLIRFSDEHCTTVGTDATGGPLAGGQASLRQALEAARSDGRLRGTIDGIGFAEVEGGVSISITMASPTSDADALAACTVAAQWAPTGVKASIEVYSPDTGEVLASGGQADQSCRQGR